MAEEGYESRFVCKLCNKKYPCGKSLGGHMRSHVVANSAEFQERVEFNPKNNSSFVDGESGNGQSGYVLRENPKKTWRAVGTRLPLPQDQVCKQCGKGFQSLKALCGHMACHSDKDKTTKDDHSWTSENQKVVFDSESETEAEEMRLRTRSSKSKRYNKLCDDDDDDDDPFLVVNNGSSSVSEIDGQEQEEVAMCLMLLSRDSSNKGGVNSVAESSDNNSVDMETKSSSDNIDSRKLKDTTLNAQTAKMENSDSGYFLDECGKAESDVSVDLFPKYRSFEGRGEDYCGEVRKSLKIINSLKNEYDQDGMTSKFESRKRQKGASSNAELCNNSPKKSKYECLNCKKVFKSYQALGGHRPCHKRSNEYRDGSGENSPDDSTYNRKSSAKNPSKKSTAKKNKGHVCPFCNRVFKNGQALGGHKRSHFIGGLDENNHRGPMARPDPPDLLDLNLPAPEANEDGGNGQFFSWR